MKILREVKCSERLPIQSENIRNIHVVYKSPKGYENTEHIHSNEKIDNEYWLGNIESWYELLEVELDSEKILPINERIEELYSDNNSKINCISDWEDKYGDFESAVYKIDQYHTALEAVESQNIELQDKVKELQGVVDGKNLMIDFLVETLDCEVNGNTKINEVINSLNQDAKTRYKTALDTYYSNKIHEGVNSSDISHKRLVKSLKIAAYGTDK